MITRYEGNPVIQPADVTPSHPDYKVMGAFNPGATVYDDEVLLLLRTAEACESEEGIVRTPIYRFESGDPYPDVVEFDTEDPDVQLKDTRGVIYKGKDYLSSLSHIRLARSKDGLNFTVEDEPFICPANEMEQYGVEDARVTRIDGRYFINYTVVSPDSWCTALAETTDFQSIERRGTIFHPENKDVAIFPEKIGGMYHALHRPNNSGFGKPSIWYAQSPDLLHWGNHRCIVHPRDNRWEAVKIGGGAPPIKTDEGWLEIYHGKGENSVYSLFCLLLDLEEPWKVLKRGEEPLMVPEEPYETEGFFGNVLFSNGVVEKDGKVYVYYGAADESACVAITDLDSLLGSL